MLQNIMAVVADLARFEWPRVRTSIEAEPEGAGTYVSVVVDLSGPEFNGTTVKQFMAQFGSTFRDLDQHPNNSAPSFTYETPMTEVRITVFTRPDWDKE